MSRPVTIVTGQWGDIPLEKLARMMSEFGYQGLELGGSHFDITRGAQDKKYCDGILALLDKYNLKVWAISGHIVGQQVCDPNDSRSDMFAPPELAGKPEEKRKWAVSTMKDAARAARNLGIEIVTGFVGSSIWHLIYSRALNHINYRGPLSVEWEDCGMEREHGAKEALEFVKKTHFEPSQIAFDSGFEK